MMFLAYFLNESISVPSFFLKSLTRVSDLMNDFFLHNIKLNMELSPCITYTKPNPHKQLGCTVDLDEKLEAAAASNFHLHVCILSHFSHAWLFKTLWTVAQQASLSTGILQARILEQVAMPFFRGSSWPRDQMHVSYVSCIGRWVLYH